MTYSELFETVYGEAPVGPEFWPAQPAEVHKAWAVIGKLADRKGFGWWFDDLEHDLQDEIFAEIVAAIADPATT